MTELRPLLAILGLLVVAGAIFIGIARLRGWRFEWWERFLSPGRTRRSAGRIEGGGLAVDSRCTGALGPVRVAFAGGVPTARSGRLGAVRGGSVRQEV